MRAKLVGVVSMTSVAALAYACTSDDDATIGVGTCDASTCDAVSDVSDATNPIDAQQPFTCGDAVPGTLDPNFGDAGIVPFDLDPDAGLWLGTTMVVQSDGRIVIGGERFEELEGPRRTLVRLHPDGRRDLSFGTNGFSDIGPVRHIHDFPSSVDGLSVQGDGRIVVATTEYDAGKGDFSIYRVTADGKSDPSFGNGGHVLTTVGIGTTLRSALAEGSDGKFVLAGTYLTRDGGPHNGGSIEPTDEADIAIARYLSSGSIDGTFGDAGTALVHIEAQDFLRGFAALPGERLVLVTQTLDYDGGAVLTRGTVVNATGAIARSFDVRSNVGKLAADDEGRVTYGASDERALALLRFASSFDALDPSFGDGGVAVARDPDDAKNARETKFAVQPDGRIIAVARSSKVTSPGPPWPSFAGNLLVARFTADGRLDPTFGSGGVALVSPPAIENATGDGDIDVSNVVVDACGAVVRMNWSYGTGNQTRSAGGLARIRR